ncbi:hypothetical protein EVAR_34627_1 [Eumeta japonica]|uniref:Retrovirus-related Pol polyprotein from transposon TNT 1-94 n=1 Tax=Eumeta variegata TaxID=151549 RepID=A0A4C1VGK4_EUMVA|nr:hypothetical protein EVAR_34627_1 [Eumeta japonica]
MVQLPGPAKTKTIALSTTEAEFVASCETAKEILWLQQLLLELEKRFVKPYVPVISDTCCGGFSHLQECMTEVALSTPNILLKPICLRCLLPRFHHVR